MRSAVPPMSRLRKIMKYPTRRTMWLALRGFGQKKKGRAVALPRPLDHVDEIPEIHMTRFRNAAKVSAFDFFHFFIAELNTVLKSANHIDSPLVTEIVSADTQISISAARHLI
jgi:hypothetical protein